MDNKYDDMENLQPGYDDFMDDGFDDELDDFDGDYSDDVEGDYTSGADAYHNYKEAKDKEEELQERLDKANEEIDKDTMEIPPEQKEETADDVSSNDSVNNSDNVSDTNSDSNDDTKKDDVPPEGTQSGRTPASERPDHSNDDGMRGVVPNQDTGSGSSLPKKDEEPKNDENKPKDDNKKDNEDSTKEKNESGDSSNKKSDKKENDDREVLAVKDDGTKVVKKNAQDHKNDKKELRNAKMANATNKFNKAKAVANMASDPVGAAGAMIKSQIATVVASALKPAIPYLLYGLLIIVGAAVIAFIVLIIISIVMVIVGVSYETTAIDTYNSSCPYITVVDSNSHEETYDLETYVAGVITGEVGIFSDSPETLKTFAVAARTYGLYTASTNNCRIQNSSSNQVFAAPSDAATQAASETVGMVLLNEDGVLALTQYDAFAYKSEDATYYTIYQKDQKLPKSWVDARINSTTMDFYKSHYHGNGMSQWGAYYLAKEEGYDYNRILNYYYPNYYYGDINGGMNGSSEMPYSPSGGNGQILSGMTLSSYLQSKGSSIQVLNQKIFDNVNNAGYGTRAGVVAAAMTLIGEANSYGITLPYVWGGGHGTISVGANPNWGNNSGLDCSGFVSWSIYNGGFRFSAQSSSSFAQFGNVVSLSSAQAVLQPGDLLWRPQNGSSTGHIVLVVSVDTTNKKYICAEANSSSTGIIFKERDFAPSNYRGIKMDRYYIDSNKR